MQPTEQRINEGLVLKEDLTLNFKKEYVESLSRLGINNCSLLCVSNR